MERKDIVKAALSKSFVLVVKSKEEAMEFSNLYSPEHLVIQTDDAEDYVELVENAGSLFLGHYTPESVGDYASGTNHSLRLPNFFEKQFFCTNSISLFTQSPTYSGKVGEY